MKKLSILLLSLLSLSFNAKADKIKLIIDAAHGGQDAGATIQSGETESELCLQFAQALQQYAMQKDIEVVMVRSEDEYVALQDRNNYQPENGIKSYFISFHMNADNTGNASGAVVRYNRNTQTAVEAQNLANKLMNGFNAISLIGTVIDDDCKAMVVKNSKVPAVLVEPGYITNQQDLKRLKQKATQQEVAMLIVKAITE